MKLKEIPSNTIVHTPTEDEARELLAILSENGYRWKGSGSMTDTHGAGTIYNLKINERTDARDYEQCVCLTTDSGITPVEFKEKYVEEEKPQPKFKVGDKIRIIQDDSVNPAYVGIVDEIANISYRFQLKNTDSNWSENVLEPYTEPKTKPTDDMETKELNLCELLAGHEGETIFLTTLGNAIIHGVSERSVQFKTHETEQDIYWLLSSGKLNKNGLVVAFPSRALYEQYPLDPYTAWMKWQEGLPKNRILKIILRRLDGSEVMGDNTSDLRFRTTADRDKCIEEIKAIIEKYSKK